MVKKVIRDFEIEYLQVLDENGNADEKLMPKLTDKQIKELYELMILGRTFDDKAFSLQRQGRIGTYIQFRGQEASQIGSAYALKDSDWMFPMYRSMGALIVRKHPMHKLLQYGGGDIKGLASPDNVNNFPIAISVGTQITHAAGCAWASKLKNEKAVSLVYFGDGASSKGDFHEGLNFAGVFKVPAIFICENNQYAISVPRERQTAAETIAQRAIGYGIEGIQVDGNDVFSVYKAVSDAVKRAREGKGATLIECFTYRLSDHTTSDDATRYRSEKEVKIWEKKDPITRLKSYMMKNKIWSEEKEKKLLDDIESQINKAIEESEKMPAPTIEDMFNYMFKEL